MKKHYILFYLLFFLPFMGLAKEETLAPTVTLSTEAVAASNALVGSGGTVYILKVLSTEAFALNGLSIKMSGTYLASDVSNLTLSRGATSNPSGQNTFVGGAAVVGNGGIAVFNINLVNVAANTAMYFFLYASISNTATTGNTIKVIGGDNPNPVTLTSNATVLTLVNNQTNVAGGLTIIKPNLTLSTEPLASSSIAFGVKKNIYVMKITNDFGINITNIKVKFSGTFLAGDISSIGFELRSTLNLAETPSNQSNQFPASLTNGNTFTLNTGGWFLFANSTKYLFISVTPTNSAEAGRTIKIDGSVYPVLINEPTTTINIVNNQSNLAGNFTIVNPDITISSISTVSETVNQNQTYVLAKLLVNSTSGINLNGLRIPFEGTVVASDLSLADFHVTASTLASSMFGTDVGFNYTILNNIISPTTNLLYNIPANTPIYLNISVKISPNAIKGHTIKIGSQIEILSTSSFTLTDNQTDIFGTKTIFAPTVTLINNILPNTIVKPGLQGNLYNFKLSSDADFSFNSFNVNISGITIDKIAEIKIGSASANYTLIQNANDITAKIIYNGFVPKNGSNTFNLAIIPSGIRPDNYKISMVCPANSFELFSNFTKPILINSQINATTELLIQASMPTNTSTVTFGTIDNSTKTSYDLGNIIASISATTNIAGGTVFSVWPTGAIARGYVPRHYEINPPAASTGASATVTLYFTQADFDAFNTISSVDIPTGPADDQGKANLRLDKYSGPSTAGSNGLDYASDFPSQFINPDDNKIIWNSLASRWEITFDVTGFSGFFVGATTTPLPVNLISFSGKNIENNINLYWKTSSETNFSHFEIQKSGNGKEFEAIGKVESKNSSFYNFSDTNPTEGQNYYKLKMIDLDGSSSFSKTISINFEKNGHYLSVENPAKNGELLVRSNYLNPHFTLLNSSGYKMVISITELPDNQHKIKAKSINSGIYFLMVEGEGKYETRKIVFE